MVRKLSFLSGVVIAASLFGMHIASAAVVGTQTTLPGIYTPVQKAQWRNDGWRRRCHYWRRECARRWGWGGWKFRRCLRRHDCGGWRD
jgi:hypothetical protein